MFFEQNAFRTRFSDLIDQNNYNSNWKKKMRFRNMLEKLEK